MESTSNNEFAQLVKSLATTTGDAEERQEIVKKILTHELTRHTTVDIVDGKQCDSGEFLTFVLDKIDLALSAYFTLLSITKKVCGACKGSPHTKSNLSRNFDVPLDPDINTAFDLQSYIHSNFKENYNDKESIAQTFHEDECPDKTQVSATTIVTRPSKLLLFILKRSGFSKKEELPKYANQPVTYPLDNLKVITEYQEICLYNLYAVIIHSPKQIGGGHYYAAIRTGVDAWYEFNDSRVTKIDNIADYLGRRRHVGAELALFYALQIKTGEEPIAIAFQW